MADKKKELLQLAWKRAYREGGFEVKCKTESQARTMRFDLYNAAKPMKNKRLEDADPELQAAKEACMVTMDEDGLTVRIIPKTSTENMQALADALGVDVEEFKTTDEVAAASSAERLLQTLGQSPAAAKPTPTEQKAMGYGARHVTPGQPGAFAGEHWSPEAVEDNPALVQQAGYVFKTKP